MRPEQSFDINVDILGQERVFMAEVTPEQWLQAVVWIVFQEGQISRSLDCSIVIYTVIERDTFAKIDYNQILDFIF